jgi:leucyl-tRNA synthetase
MSKSKRNTVDPGAIIARFGADTARWFILSDNPPDRDMEWTEAGVVGAYRFIQRLFRLAENVAVLAVGDDTADVPSPAARTLRRATHRTIKAVTEALESFAFHVAVARVHELANAIGEAERAPDSPDLRWARREAMEMAARLVTPMIPHLAEEILWRLRPDETLAADLPWPEADPILAAPEKITVAVQVMGKLRGTVDVTPDAPAEEVLAAAEAESNVARALQGRRVVKRIFVPGRIVNFVVAPER